MIKHILKRLSILNTYNTHVFDLVQFVKPRSIMNSCVSKHLTTAFNLWLFCPTLIKSGQLLGLFDRVGTCTRVHTYLGGVTSWLQVFYSLPFGDLLQCIQNSPDSTGVSKDSVVLLSKPPVCTLLPGFNLCRTLHWNNSQKTWPYIFHYFLIFKFNYTFVKCTIYSNRFILKESLSIVSVSHLIIAICVCFVAYIKHPCDVSEHISLKLEDLMSSLRSLSDVMSCSMH